MSKSSFALIIASVMLAVFVLGRQADSDVPDVDIFGRYSYTSCARFELSSQPEDSNVLRLIITPFTYGDYSYSFSRISRDSDYTEDSSEGYYEYSNRSNVIAYFTCDVPPEGTRIQYKVRASFVPDTGSHRSSGCNSCGSRQSSSHEDVRVTQYVPAYLSVTVTVFSATNGTTYISIEEEE